MNYEIETPLGKRHKTISKVITRNGIVTKTTESYNWARGKKISEVIKYCKSVGVAIFLTANDGSRKEIKI